MADRRTLESAAQAVQEKLEIAKREYEDAVKSLDTAQFTVDMTRTRVALLQDAYELVKPKPRVRKAAKVPA